MPVVPVRGEDVLKSPELFATDKFPLRSSALKTFVECPMRYLHTLGDEFVPNDRMNTGSAVHYLIERHELTKSEALKRDYDKAFRDFPLAKQSEVREYYVEGYVKKHHKLAERWGEVVGTERAARLETHPATFDKTKSPIVITCTIDQLRYDAKTKTFHVIDFKVSTQPIAGMIRTYALQLATYVLAIKAEHPDARVEAHVCNPLIMAKPRALFCYSAGFTVKRCNELMDTVRAHVASIRASAPTRVAGYGCQYCPKRNPSKC